MKPTLADIETLARNAGAILREGYDKEHDIKYKSEIDLVTEIDHASEKYLLGEINTRFPGGHIFAEESGETKGENEDIWYIDPLDGTVNYAHRVPIFCVSIAFASHETLELGAVYDPLLNEMFSAERRKGAFLNGKQIHVSKTTELKKSLLVTGFPYDTWNTPRNNFDYFIKLAKMTQGVRRLGSAALDGCYVAAGRFDGFWELSLKSWDVAAAALSAQEAGAKVSSIDGDADYLSPPISVIISTPTIYDQMLEALK